MTGPPDDPSDRPTRMADYGAGGAQQLLEREPVSADATEPDVAPWYRNRILLALWALMVGLLLGLIIYGIVELSRGGGAGGPSSTSSTTPTRSSTTSPTSTPSASSEAPPPPESPEQTPEEAPPPANNAPAAPPSHHHHHPHIPSTITLPHTVITLPHGF